MAGIVFILCMLTSLLCSVLLFRGYKASRARLLLWSSLCFLGLGLNNGLLYYDTHIATSIDLSLLRELPAFLGVCCLLYGVIMEKTE